MDIEYENDKAGEVTMGKIKRIIYATLSIILLMGLCACSSSDSERKSDSVSHNKTEKEKGNAESKNKVPEFKVGETWTVDGQWSIMINSVKETDQRNEYADAKPGAVYMVDYTYTNLGYEDPYDMSEGLYITLTDTIVDAKGTMGYEYPGDISSYPQETPVGATCKAQACIGVENPGVFIITLNVYDSSSDSHKAKFIMDPEAAAVESQKSENQTDRSKTLKMNETWTVPGQWELTITGVNKVDERNEYEEKEPEAVYIVDYTYKNLGYEDKSGAMDGLFFSLDDSIVDSQGTMGYSYPGDIEKYPEETPTGASCNAQACIGVDHAGSFMINISTYDGKGTQQKQSFLIETE